MAKDCWVVAVSDREGGASMRRPTEGLPVTGSP